MGRKELLLAAATVIFLVGVAIAISLPPRLTTETVKPPKYETVTLSPDPASAAQYQECVQRYGADYSLCLALKPKPIETVELTDPGVYETRRQNFTLPRAIVVGSALALALFVAAFAVGPSRGSGRDK
jgi:hypothetical protein